jgi:cardiolipin-specific phospholipase
VSIHDYFIAELWINFFSLRWQSLVAPSHHIFEQTMLFLTSMTVATKLELMRAAEGRLLQLAKQFGARDPNDYTMELFDTPIPSSVVPLKHIKNGEEQLTIHGVKVMSHNNLADDNTAKLPLVLLHGYMNGAMYFYRNLVGLTNYFPTIYSLDSLGWGLSSRPTWSLKDDSISTTEDFFVESLEAWRRHHKIDKMILAGHSMGGYISVAYCERYPERVDRLILLSPVGVPDAPQSSGGFSMQRWFAKTLFEYGTTPCSVVRTMPENRARGYVSAYVDHRIPAITDMSEKEAVTDYLYLNMALPGSGEYCLKRLLTFTAFGKQPTVHRIPHLNVKNVSFLYGQVDWMDSAGGLEVQRMCESSSKASPAIDVYQIKNAGHLLMLDNWEEFNSAVILSGGGRVSAKAPMPSKLTPKKQTNGTVWKPHPERTLQPDNFSL